MILTPYYLFVVCSLVLFGAGMGGLLGVEPLKEAQDWMGWGAIFAIILSLSIQPIMMIFQVKLIHPFKKSFGLVAFFFALLHFLLYQLDHGFSLELMSEDFLVRHHIKYGMISFFILGLLAITSQQRVQKIMKKNWKRLHRLVYVAAIFMALHVLTSTKSIEISDVWPLVVIIILLIFRLKKISLNLRRFFHPLVRKKIL